MLERTLFATALVCALPVSAAAQGQIAHDPIGAVMELRRDDGSRAPMALTAERLRVEIDAQHATTELAQVYRNQTGATVEGRYALRAGAGARVDAFAYWNGEDKIVGEVFELDTARAVYDSVTQRGRDPGLLEKTGEGEFAFKVFPIAAGEDKRVELSYTRWLGRRDGVVSYRAPVSRPDADIEVIIRDDRPIKDVHSSSHAIVVTPIGKNAVRVRARPRRDAGAFALRYRIDAAPLTLSGHLHRDPGHDGYFAITIASADVAPSAVSPRDVTLVIDRSGSMSGAPLANARRAAAGLVRRLRDTDRVNVVAFDSEADALFRQPETVAAARDRALGFIDGLRDGGGTDIAGALARALEAQADGERTRVILFLTDGRSEAQRALEVASADRRDVRVFTVGVGEAVDRPLLARLAALKRGDFTFIAAAEEIEDKVEALGKRIEAPVMVDLALEVSGDATAVRVYPRTLPDLFAADELVISGRLRGAGKATITLRGRAGGKAVAPAMHVEVPERAHRPWVGRLWAQARIDHLLEEIALSGETEELKNEAVELALAYNVVTRYTAFLAIPASELDAASADRLARARAKKELVAGRHVDATQLAQSASGRNDQVTMSGATVSENRYVVDGADADDAPAPGAVQRRGSGCAGCSSQGGGAGGLALVFLVAVALCSRHARGQVRRHRRTRGVGSRRAG